MGVETFIDVLGFSAGVLVAASLLPQIWRAHERESAEDLSFFWQGTVSAGISLQLIYLYHYGMWAVFYPLCAELAFILYLAGLKSYYEHHLLGLGRGGGDRPFVKKPAGLSSNDDYTVIGGGPGGSGEGTSLDSSGVGGGSGRWAAVAGGEDSGEDTATSDSTGQG